MPSFIDCAMAIGQNGAHKSATIREMRNSVPMCMQYVPTICYPANPMRKPIAILGAGNAGTALALILARHKRPIRLWCIEPDVEREINVKHRNTKYLKGHALPGNISASPDLAHAVAGADTVIIAVPSFALRDTVRALGPHLAPHAIIGCITKGIDEESLLPLSLIASKLLPPAWRKRVVALAGPAVAHELAEDKPSAFLLAGATPACVQHMAHLLESRTVKAATSRDLLGVGYAMGLKNCYAIALGLCDGLRYPMNTKALVLSLAVEEMEHLLAKAGAHADTAATLAGLGDLIVTGMSPHGRNRTYGERLVGAKTKDPHALGLLTVEGIAATAQAMRLARSLKAKTPLLDAIDACLRAKKGFERPFVVFLEHLRLA